MGRPSAKLERAERADVQLQLVGPLLPRHRCELPSGHRAPLVFLEREAGLDVARFRALFVETWASLPLWARRRILAFWRSPGFPRFGATVRVVRLLGETDMLGNEFAVRMNAIGAVSSGGRLVRFAGDWIDHLSDVAVRTLIAHELAHVLFCAEGRVYTDEDPNDALSEEHLDVYETMGNWGYDDDVISLELCALVPNPR